MWLSFAVLVARVSIAVAAVVHAVDASVVFLIHAYNSFFGTDSDI